LLFWLMTDDIRAGVISYEATNQSCPFSDTRSGVISFESIRKQRLSPVLPCRSLLFVGRIVFVESITGERRFFSA